MLPEPNISGPMACSSVAVAPGVYSGETLQFEQVLAATPRLDEPGSRRSWNGCGPIVTGALEGSELQPDGGAASPLGPASGALASTGAPVSTTTWASGRPASCVATPESPASPEVGSLLSVVEPPHAAVARSISAKGTRMVFEEVMGDIAESNACALDDPSAAGVLRAKANGTVRAETEARGTCLSTPLLGRWKLRPR